MDILFSSIQYGDLGEVKQLIESNSTLLQTTNHNGVSPLLFALYCRKMDVADYLKSKLEKLSPFEAAATGAQDELDQAILNDVASINSYSNDGHTLLGLACFFGHENTARLLIEAGADVNLPSKNKMGVYPIHAAAASGSNVIVQLLIENKADVNMVQAAGTTALHTAIHRQNTDMVKILLQAGANVKLKMEDGTPTLVLAEETGNDEIIDLIEEACTRS